MRVGIIVLLTLLVDQASKYAVSTYMAQGESIPVLPPVFYLTYILNPGAAFGILANRTAFFIAVGVLVVGGVLVGYRFLPRERVWTRLALGLVVGGALGNLIDRVRLGRVIDFLDFRVWPVFNLADTAIVTGALLLLLDVWRAGSKEDKEKQEMDTGGKN